MTIANISEFVKKAPVKKTKKVNNSPYYKYLDEIIDLRQKGYEYKEIEKIFRDHNIIIHYSKICKILKEMNKHSINTKEKNGEVKEHFEVKQCRIEERKQQHSEVKQDQIVEDVDHETSLTSIDAIKEACLLNPFLKLTDDQIHIIIPEVKKLTNNEVTAQGILTTTYRKQRFDYKKNYEKLKTKPGEYFSEIKEFGKILD